MVDSMLVSSPGHSKAQQLHIMRFTHIYFKVVGDSLTQMLSLVHGKHVLGYCVKIITFQFRLPKAHRSRKQTYFICSLANLSKQQLKIFSNCELYSREWKA